MCSAIHEEGDTLPNTNSIAEHSAVTSLLYTEFDAARYLRIPLWAVLLIAGDTSQRSRFKRSGWFGSTNDDFPQLPDEHYCRLSFRTLAMLFVSSEVIRSHSHKFPLPWRYRDVLLRFEEIRRASGSFEPDPRWFTEPDWVLGVFGAILHPEREADQTQLLKQILLHQSRVEQKDGIPIRLFPFSRDPATEAPRTIVIDPEIRFGRPTVKGAPTDVLVERWRAGDRCIELAEDYGLTVDEVEEALRYETQPDRECQFSDNHLFV